MAQTDVLHEREEKASTAVPREDGRFSHSICTRLDAQLRANALVVQHQMHVR